MLAPVGVVSEVWRYPIKSAGGVPAETAELVQRGLHGDRAFAVYGNDHKIGSGKSTRRFRRMDGLLGCRARFAATGELLLAMPSGEAHRVPSAAANEALSRHVGEPVRIEPETTIPHFDVAAIHLVSSASLDWLAQRLGVRAVEAARFRPNLVVDVPGGAPHVEEAWTGRRLHVGGAILAVTAPTERCVMVGLAQPGLASDERILRLLAQEHDACFGVYASVVRPGSISRGDRVQLEST